MLTTTASHILVTQPHTRRFAPLCIKGLLSLTMAGCLSLAFLSPAVAADFSGSLKGVSITDAQAANKPPTAAFTYTVSGNTVTFDASGSSDSDGTITEYKWNFGDGALASGAKVQHTYSTNTASPVTLTVLDNNNGAALSQKSIIFQVPFNLAINFQPSNVAVPLGFMVDSGAPFDLTKGYGWVVAPTSSRDRDSSYSPDQSYDTLVYMTPNAIWEASLPNGTYNVTICTGDPGFPNGIPAIQAEEINLISGESLSSTKKWIEKTSILPVNDERITIKFSGSTDPVRICWIKISSI